MSETIETTCSICNAILVDDTEEWGVTSRSDTVCLECIQDFEILENTDGIPHRNAWLYCLENPSVDMNRTMRPLKRSSEGGN